MPDVVAVVGPTATGKSDLAVALAERLDGEIVNADSMQLYAGMDIGTAKLPLEARRSVPHHLLDVWPISKSAAVAAYQQLARAAIAEIRMRRRVPILVGGSGLYLRGALDRLEFPGESPDIRASLYAELEHAGAPALHARLATLDATAAASILPTNGRRIVRALEVIELTGRPFIATMPGFESVYDCVHLGLDRDDLDERVEQRVARMMAAGFLDEVRALRAAGYGPALKPLQALGYKQLGAVLDGAMPLPDAVAETVRATAAYARRQRTWFRKEKADRRFDGVPDLEAALAAVTGRRDGAGAARAG